MKTTLLLALFLTACAPWAIDSGQTPAEIAGWGRGIARIYNASGHKIDPDVRPCDGVGCAHTVDKLRPKRIGQANKYKAEAMALKGLDDELGQQVKTHELLHTLGVLHVTSKSVMNPIANRSYDCISEAELFQLCTIWKRCAWQKPECHVEPGWKIIVPIAGKKHEIDPLDWRQLYQSGKSIAEFVGAL